MSNNMKNKINYKHAINNTDKFSGGIYGSGSYGHNYQLIYKNFITHELGSILEIGTANGGFAKFLIDNDFKSLLVGADINPTDKHKHVQDHTNYNHLYNDFYTGDAFTEMFLKWINDKQYKFDLIIEDGDHSSKTQAFMLSNCDKLLTDSGVYICEDVQGGIEVARQLIKFIPVKYKKYSYIWDGVSSVDRADDICVIVDLR